MAKKAQPSLGERLVKSMQGAVEALEQGEPLTFRTVVMKLEPSVYDAKKVISTRKLMGISQGMFARFLGVSPATVQAWERGGKDPSDIACRFMDEIRRNPKYWLTRLRESIKVKTAG